MQWKCVIAEEQRAPRGRGKERSKMGRMERGGEQKDGKEGEEEEWGGRRLREVGREGKGGKEREGKKEGEGRDDRTPQISIRGRVYGLHDEKMY